MYWFLIAKSKRLYLILTFAFFTYVP